MKSRSPLFKYTLFFALGIVTTGNIILSPTLLSLLLLSLFTLSLILYLINSKKRVHPVNVALNCSLLILYFFLGSWSASLSYNRGVEGVSQIIARVEREPLQLLVERKSYSKKGNSATLITYSKRYRERVVLFTNSDELIKKIDEGQILTINPKLKEIWLEERFQPGYRDWLIKKGCYSWGYLNKRELIDITTDALSIFTLSRELKRPFIDKIRERSRGEVWGETLIALTTGEKEELDREVVEWFKKSGTMHLMAVSGLHIGFLYFLITNLLSLLGRGSYKNFIKGGITLSIIWIYALVSGLSTSSVRASLMVTVLIISQLLSKEYSTLNALSISALITLLYNPNAIFLLGFQLSYCAILSILLINPYFEKSFRVKNPIFRRALKVLSITLSVQLGLSAIIVLNFGELPLYSLISNIVVIPIASIVIPVAILAISLEFLVAIPAVIYKFLKIGVEFMMQFLSRVEELPGNLIVVEQNSIEQYFLVSLTLILSIYTIVKGLYPSN
ncbi:MAG: ComEC/Rec2 family competence protein [Bacteroidales bacterium]